MASPISMASPVLGTGDSNSEAAGRGSRPPSPSLVPGGHPNPYAVNDKLKERTPTFFTPEIESHCSKACKALNDVIEIGGIPLRPWMEYTLEDVPQISREWQRQLHVRRNYREQEDYWTSQLALWACFAKQRSSNSEPDLRTLDPVSAVTGLAAFLRDHMDRDKQDRTKPGREVFDSIRALVQHRHFTDTDVLKTLAAAEIFLAQARDGKGLEPPAIRSVKRASKRLAKEYDLPPCLFYTSLWDDSQYTLSDEDKSFLLRRGRKALPPSDSEDDTESEGRRTPKISNTQLGSPSKRQRGELEEDEQSDAEYDPRPQKRVALTPERPLTPETILPSTETLLKAAEPSSPKRSRDEFEQDQGGEVENETRSPKRVARSTEPVEQPTHSRCEEEVVADGLVIKGGDAGAKEGDDSKCEYDPSGNEGEEGGKNGKQQDGRDEDGDAGEKKGAGGVEDGEKRGNNIKNEGEKQDEDKLPQDEPKDAVTNGDKGIDTEVTDGQKRDGTQTIGKGPSDNEVVEKETEQDVAVGNETVRPDKPTDESKVQETEDERPKAEQPLSQPQTIEPRATDSAKNPETPASQDANDNVPELGQSDGTEKAGHLGSPITDDGEQHPAHEKASNGDGEETTRE